MKLLLDTVALYRAATAPESLPAAVRAALSDESHQLLVSIASAWELAIKSSLGKLVLPCPLEAFFTQTTRDLLAESVGLELAFVAKVAELPFHHGDPFDRLIIAQALLRDCTVVTNDPRFAAYGVKVLW
jgi:PIN domain nuclease of toxin-antitoxin system